MTLRLVLGMMAVSYTHLYPKWDGQKPGLSLALWAQYVLDSFSTVEETVEALSREEFILVTADMPGLDKLATVHLAVSDSLGDSAIFEYVDGKLVIHHDSSCLVMTNSPTYQPVSYTHLDVYKRQTRG